MHPPRPICPQCLSRSVAFEIVSGKAVVYSYTINRYPWSDRQQAPYIVAEIDLVEQPGLRLLSNLVDCTPEEVGIGLAVEVTFEAVDDVWIPLFRPC